MSMSKEASRLMVLMVGTALASLATIPSTMAQTEAPGTAQAVVRTFHIPAQPLSEALIQFGRQSGLQVSADASVIRDMRSAGVTGTLTRDQALTALLAGTGLVYRINGSMVALERPGAAAPGAIQLDPVQVQAAPVPQQAEIGAPARAFAGGLVDRNNRVGALGNRDYMDTPFSISTYTEKTIRDQQAVTMVEVVAVDPTIRSNYGQSNNDDRLMIRGIQSFPRDWSFNGLYGVSPEFVTGMAGIERVEIFRGPTALLNGQAPRGAVGGTINLVPKRAPNDGIIQATARYVSSSQFGGHLDVGQRFGPDGALGLRANVAYLGGDTSFANGKDSLFEATLGGDYRGSDTRLDFDIGYLSRRINGQRNNTGLAAGQPVPWAPDPRGNFYPPWGFQNYDDLYGMMRFEHDLAPTVTAFLKVGGRRTNNTGMGGAPTIVNQQGAATGSASFNKYWVETLSAEGGVRGLFQTGGVAHELVLNTSYRLEQWGSRFTAINAPFTTNIYNPSFIPTPVVPFAATQGAPLGAQLVTTGAGVVDAMSAFGGRVQLIAGGRVQNIGVSNYDLATGVTTAATPGYSASAFTPSVSAVAKPWTFLTFYGNYIEALEQGPIAGPTLNNAGQTFSPFISRQLEVGAKLDLGYIGATLGAFQITRQSSFIANNTLTVDGQQRNRGLEFIVFGEPLPGLVPLGGFTLLDAALTSTANGTNNGKRPPGVPDVMVNFGLDWSTPFVRGLTVGGRVTYTGNAYMDAANTQLVAPWTRFDLSARYVFERADGKPIALRANVYNVGNANYWMAGGQLTQPTPQTFMLSLTADF